MKKKIIKISLLLLGIFLLLFLFRIFYGYTKVPASTSLISQNAMQSDRYSLTGKNYASSQIKYYSKSGKMLYQVDQKYEKVATMLSSTDKMDEDEKKLRDSVVRHNSLIQYEQSLGLKSRRNRRLNLTIGVQPEKFDTVVAELKQIGHITSLNIDKKDKSNEYKDLQAKKNSLLSIRTSLINLKSRGGKIQEFIELENRILEIEKEIQQTGISLGEFDAENEFCTVKFSLFEKNAAAKISLLHRIKVALEWSIKIFLKLMIMLFFTVLSALVIVVLLMKLSWVKDWIKKVSDTDK